MTRKILISACLLGAPVRYDGDGRALGSEHLARWRAQGRLVAVCPEVDGGLPVPRPPAEIVGGHGTDVLAARARILTGEGVDVTDAFLRGARRALAQARLHDVAMAVLKARSPSCGALAVYDGTFSGTLRAGRGTTAALLALHGIAVFDEDHLDAAARFLAAIDPTERHDA